MNGAKRIVLALFLALTLAGTAVTSALASPAQGCQGLVVSSVVGGQGHEQAAGRLGGCDGSLAPASWSWGVSN